MSIWLALKVFFAGSAVFIKHIVNWVFDIWEYFEKKNQKKENS